MIIPDIRDLIQEIRIEFARRDIKINVSNYNTDSSRTTSEKFAERNDPKVSWYATYASYRLITITGVGKILIYDEPSFRPKLPDGSFNLAEKGAIRVGFKGILTYSPIHETDLDLSDPVKIVEAAIEFWKSSKKSNPYHENWEKLGVAIPDMDWGAFNKEVRKLVRKQARASKKSFGDFTISHASIVLENGAKVVYDNGKVIVES